MTKKRKFGIETAVLFSCYVVLVLMIVLEQNILDIGYLIVLSIYLVRLFICRLKKKSFK